MASLLPVITSPARPAKPLVRSLLVATATLDEVLLSLDLEDRLVSAHAEAPDDVIEAAATTVDPVCASLHAALVECLGAVQDHIEAIEGTDGALARLAFEEPRLISRLERLDGALNGLLPRLTEACAAQEQAVSLAGPLRQLVLALRSAADGELEIFNEALVPTGSGD